MSDRRLIEEALPLREISSEATIEKSTMKGPINTMHTWWARRPLVACRAAVLGSLLRDNGDNEDRRNLLSFLVKACQRTSSDDSALMEKARQLVSQHNGGKPPRVLDCFAGGGAIPLEALRLGCETYALELNPVAVLVELCTLVYPQRYGVPFTVDSKQKDLKGSQRQEIRNRLARDIEHWSTWVLEQSRGEISRYYPHRGKASPMAYLWARTVRCPNPGCSAEVPLLRQLWLVNRPDKKIAMKMAAKKDKIEFSIADSGRIDFDPDVGTMRAGSAECPMCKSGISGDYIKEACSSGKMGERLLVTVLTTVHGKEYHLPNTLEERAFSDAQQRLEQLKKNVGAGQSLIPNEPISRDWPRTVLLPLYGLTSWNKAFNPRQTLSLVTFVQKIREAYHHIVAESQDKEYAKAVVTFLALALDRLADSLSSLTPWDIRREHGVNTFGRQAIPMVWDYAESNPIGDASGGWESAINGVLHAVENVSGTGHACVVTQGTATRLPYTDGFFDAVITDPPYYSAVPYADLSDFFYVWLKRTVGSLYPELFGTPLTPKGPEIVEQMKHSSLKNRKDKAFFEREMSKALGEITRVLKPDGICTIVFAHKTTAAWEALVQALLTSGLDVMSSWPLYTERPGRLRAQESAALASSVWLVCRRRMPDAGVGSWKSVQTELNERVKDKLDHFISQGIKGADALLSAIGPALEVFGKYEKVEKVTGEQVTVGEFLDKVREVVAHHALTTVLSEQELGRLDAETAFYVLWKWTFEPSVAARNSAVEEDARGEQSKDGKKSRRLNGNHILIPFDDALKLARSVGAEIEFLLKTRGLLEQEKEYVHLTGPVERKNISGLGETARDGTPPAIIDMIHRALNLWAAQERDKLDEYLRISGAENNETFWMVAQALSNLLPLQSREKQILDGLLAQRTGAVLDVARSLGTRKLDEFVREEVSR